MKKLGRSNLSSRVCRIANLLLMTVVFGLMWYAYYVKYAPSTYFRKGDWLAIFIFMILYFFIGKTYDAFQIALCRISEMVYSQVLTIIVTDCIMYLVTILAYMRLVNPMFFLLALIVQIVIAIAWSYLVHKWYYREYPRKRTAVVFDVREGMEKLVAEYGYDVRFDVIRTIHIDECIANIELLKDCEVVFLSGIHSRERNVILKYCLYNNIDVYVIPRIGDIIMSSAQKRHMFHLPMLKVGRYSPTIEYLISKRIFDVVISVITLILLSPFMLITAIAIKLDGGPIFYKQTRLTMNGKEFKVLKFRSMRVDAEKDGVARLSTGENDDRITPVGKFIRKIRFDEVPQLFNVLKGDMSIVGPRPERPEIAAEYESEMPEFKLRLQVKAGLTGYAQVYGKYNTAPYDKLQMDLMYIASASIVEDIKICFATIKILFSKESTEGVEIGQTTAADCESSVNNTETATDLVAK